MPFARWQHHHTVTVFNQNSLKTFNRNICPRNVVRYSWLRSTGTENFTKQANHLPKWLTMQSLAIKPELDGNQLLLKLFEEKARKNTIFFSISQNAILKRVSLWAEAFI